MKKFISLAMLVFFLLLGAVSGYGEEYQGYAFTIEFLGFLEGATKKGEPFVLTFSGEQDLVNKAYSKCGKYHGMYFIQPVYKMVGYSAVAQCFVRGEEA